MKMLATAALALLTLTGGALAQQVTLDVPAAPSATTPDEGVAIVSFSVMPNGDSFSFGFSVDGVLSAINHTGIEGVIAYLCAVEPRSEAVEMIIDGTHEFMFLRDGNELILAGAEDSKIVGHVAVPITCPMPEAVGPVAEFTLQTWTMHRNARYPSEFTDAHLRAVLNYMRENPNGEIIDRTDIPENTHGNYRVYINTALAPGNSATGQLVGWIVPMKHTNITYFIIKNECNQCGSQPVVIWHVHERVIVHAPAPAAAPTPARALAPALARTPYYGGLPIITGQQCCN